MQQQQIKAMGESLMDGWDFLVGSLICLAIAGGIIGGYQVYTMFASDLQSHHGELINVEYSQSGYGHADIMVLYFKDGTILRLSNPLSNIHLGNCTVDYRGNDYLTYFVSIDYN